MRNKHSHRAFIASAILVTGIGCMSPALAKTSSGAQVVSTKNYHTPDLCQRGTFRGYDGRSSDATLVMCKTKSSDILFWSINRHGHFIRTETSGILLAKGIARYSLGSQQTIKTASAFVERIKERASRDLGVTWSPHFSRGSQALVKNLPASINTLKTIPKASPATPAASQTLPEMSDRNFPSLKLNAPQDLITTENLMPHIPTLIGQSYQVPLKDSGKKDQGSFQFEGLVRTFERILFSPLSKILTLSLIVSSVFAYAVFRLNQFRISRREANLRKLALRLPVLSGREIYAKLVSQQEKPEVISEVDLMHYLQGRKPSKESVQRVIILDHESLSSNTPVLPKSCDKGEMGMTSSEHNQIEEINTNHTDNHGKPAAIPQLPEVAFKKSEAIAQDVCHSAPDLGNDANRDRQNISSTNSGPSASPSFRQVIYAPMIHRTMAKRPSYVLQASIQPKTLHVI